MQATSETLWIVNTRTCNLGCTYCYQADHAWTWQKDAGLVKNMPDEVMREAVKWAPRWAKSGLRVNWYGGEPLLRFALMKKWTPVFDLAFKDAQKSLVWSVTTNGTYLKEEQRAFMDQNNVGVLLSLDGPPELHDQTRYFAGGKPSWEAIDPVSILKWRPKIEIVWQLDPDYDIDTKYLDWMIGEGFEKINFNVNWLKEWPAEKRLELERFMRYVARLCIQSSRGGKPFNSNWFGKLNEALIKDTKMPVPCGTGLHMLGLTPEGDLFPSQEMCFTVYEPGKAKGTADYYRVGNVFKDPVMDHERLAIVSEIKTDEMKTPPGFECNNCVANPVSIGGCHCRYVGEDGVDPANRYNIKLGYCQSMQSAMTGLFQGAIIERYIGFKSQRPTAPAIPIPEQSSGRVDLLSLNKQIAALDERFNKLSKSIDEAPILRMEAENA